MFPTKIAPAPSAFCLIAKPIYWAAADTDDTIKQVKEHNAAWKALCATPAKPLDATS